MSEPIIYALKLCSYDVNVDIADNSNADTTFNVGRFFAKIAAVHGVNKCKIEVDGCMFSSEVYKTMDIPGIDFIIKIPGCISTSYNTNGLAYPVLCCATSFADTGSTAEAINIQYKSTIYCSDIANITQIEIIMYNSTLNTSLAGDDFTTSYSLMLHVTPIYN